MMIRKSFRSNFVLGLTLLLLAVSCQKDDDPSGPKIDPNKPVATTDANALAAVLVFPNEKEVKEAALPASSPAAEAPEVVNYDKSISYSSGSKLSCQQTSRRMPISRAFIFR